MYKLESPLTGSLKPEIKVFTLMYMFYILFTPSYIYKTKSLVLRFICSLLIGRIRLLILKLVCIGISLLDYWIISAWLEVVLSLFTAGHYWQLYIVGHWWGGVRLSVFLFNIPFWPWKELSCGNRNCTFQIAHFWWLLVAWFGSWWRIFCPSIS